MVDERRTGEEERFPPMSLIPPRPQFLPSVPEQCLHDLYAAETLYHAGQAVSGTLDLTEVVDLVLEHLAEIVPYHRAAVLLQNRDNELEIVAVRGFPAEAQPLQMRIFVQEENAFQQISRTKQPLSIPDVSECPDWQQAAGLPPARAWLGVPLIRFEKVMGMLSLARDVAAPYDDDEVTLAAMSLVLSNTPA